MKARTSPIVGSEIGAVLMCYADIPAAHELCGLLTLRQVFPGWCWREGLQQIRSQYMAQKKGQKVGQMQNQDQEKENGSFTQNEKKESVGSALLW